MEKMEAIDKGILIQYANPIKVKMNLSYRSNIFDLIEGFLAISEELALDFHIKNKIRKLIGERPQYIKFLEVMEKTLNEVDIEIDFEYSGDDSLIDAFLNKRKKENNERNDFKKSGK